jgi:hypothetical protein
MPGAGTKQQKSESIAPIGAGGEPQIAPNTVLSDFEQMCVELSPSGALVAVRDLAGLRCTISFGTAPAVGSRLPADFLLLNQCLETGEFALCDDAASDARIPASLATSLNFRSAIAVPIQAQGSVVGLMEVFCAQPCAIHPIAIARLTEIAKSFAALLIFDAADGGQPIVGGPLESPIVLPRLVVDEQPASAPTPDAVNLDAASPDAANVGHATPGPDEIEAPQNQHPRRAATTSVLPSDRPIPTRVWLIAAVLLLGLSLLLLFLFRSGSSQSTYRANPDQGVCDFLVSA